VKVKEYNYKVNRTSSLTASHLKKVITKTTYFLLYPCTKLYRNQSKMLSSKKIDLKRDFAAGVYLSETPFPSRFLFGVV
jgi:hypothetical protein